MDPEGTIELVVVETGALPVDPEVSLVLVETRLLPVAGEVGPAALVDAGTVPVNVDCDEDIKLVPLSVDKEAMSVDAREEMATKDEGSTCLVQAEVVELGILLTKTAMEDFKTGIAVVERLVTVLA